MTSVEFSPHAYFTRIMNYWWIVMLATFLGGVLGFIFFTLHPSVYEATATYFVTLDLTRFPTLGVREDLIQYNEDMALNTTEGALLSTEVVNSVILQAKDIGVSLITRELLDNSTIERKHDIWELRYRSHDPSVAQSIVNIWAKSGYQAMLSWQASGLAPDFVVFQPPTLALLPNRPVLYGRSNLMLAGSLLGFIIGVVLATRLRPTLHSSLPAVSSPLDV